ncbi:2Fe-2S iron-sulfur cluster-binding protein [Novosphingobium pokkalii]|uniref:2Fe-2S iron-sulfur cluster-binding protein n=1 Tax=Novosphingobium pokkalii TaxID=1770194 RepID=UPI00364364E5
MSGETARFTFDGKSYTAQAGQTLAAALLANGVAVVARSFKYHRPRGIMAAGVEEPSALVTVGEGAAPNPIPAPPTCSSMMAWSRAARTPGPAWRSTWGR